MEQSHWIVEPTCHKCNGIAETLEDGPLKKVTTCFECGWVRVEELKTWEVTEEYVDPNFSKVRMKAR